MEINLLNENQKSASCLLFNNIAFNIISYLETFLEISEINFFSSLPLKNHEINFYEKKILPFEFPSDFKRFLFLFNGLHLKWKIKIQEQNLLIGEIKINKLDQILPIQIEGQFLTTKVNDLEIVIPDSKTSIGYVFSISEEGMVVFLYRDLQQQRTSTSSSSSSSFPEIWFVDNLKRWHFVCFSFTQYLRLAVLHLGIIGWHGIYTPEGITMTTRQWMSLFCRERLCVYQNQRLI